jgi:DNA-binding NtrC family response regulator
MATRLLVVDDDVTIRTSLSEALEEDGYDVRCAEDAEGALSSFSQVEPDIVLADVRMPGLNGLELLGLLRQRSPDTDVLIMTAYDDMPTVVAAMREGAADFLLKPVDLHHLRRVLVRVAEDRRARSRSRPSSRPPDPDGDGPAGTLELVGRHPRMIEIFKLVGKLATSRANVLVRGESGTGKELIARAVHSSSPDAAQPFVPVNCTALPATLLESELFGHVRGSFTGAHTDRRGRFALAGRGTIFLDEIGDTSPEFQTKLLRVLQEREYYPVGADRPERTEARVIAATHRDLEELVRAGQFRADLYYRLLVVEVSVPPLRERLSDIPLLAEHLVQRACAALGLRPPVLSAAALRELERRDWPGNVRELENCLTRALVMASGDVIRPDHISPGPEHASSAALLRTLAEAERDHVLGVYGATGGHKSRTAEILGISRPRLDRLLEQYEQEDTGSNTERK